MIERLARWLLPSADEMTQGEMAFFSFLAITCGMLVIAAAR